MSDEIEQLFKAADEARAYISITNEMGPSEQLLAFINFDGKLEEEIGLEGYNAMSLQARHEILLSKINPNLLESIGIESLISKIDTMSKWLMGVGAALGVGSVVVAEGSPDIDGKTAGAFIAGLVAFVIGGITKIVIDSKYGIISYQDFKRAQKIADSVFEEELFISSHLPTSFSLEKWINFKTVIKKFPVGNDSRFRNERIETEVDKNNGTVHSYLTHDDYLDESYTRSGTNHKYWNENEFKSAVMWLDKSFKNLKDLVDKQNKKLVIIRTWAAKNADSKDPDVRDVYRIITSVIGYQYSGFVEYKRMLNKVAKELSNISKYFKSDKDKTS